MQLNFKASKFCLPHIIPSEPPGMVKNLPKMQETQVQFLGQEDLPGEGNVFLPTEFHGQRSLTGYSPLDRKESDTTE